MGCSNDSNEIILKFNKKTLELYEAYLSMKSILYSIKDYKRIEHEVYLIKTKSIQKFIDCINNANILNCPSNNDEENINSLYKLNKSFEEYNLENNNIEFFYDPQNLEENNNDFIIVDQLFIEKMKINNNDLEKKKVILDVDNNRKKMKIRFQNSEKLIEKKTEYSYKFIFDNNSNQSSSNDNNNNRNFNQQNINNNINMKSDKQFPTNGINKINFANIKASKEDDYNIINNENNEINNSNLNNNNDSNKQNNEEKNNQKEQNNENLSKKPRPLSNRRPKFKVVPNENNNLPVLKTYRYEQKKTSKK